MKSDRLLSIILLLQTRGLVRAAELAERLEVSVRTIYRDVEALSASGVPLYTERGRHGGIALLPGFRTDVTGLTEDESRALFVLTARGAHAALGLDAALGSALRKVMAAIPAPHRPAAELTSRRVIVEPERWETGREPAVDLDVLNSAVFGDRRLALRYRRGGAVEPGDYVLDPYGLVVKAGVWYLVADKSGSPRLFRADRVVEASVLDEPVRRRPGLELADVWRAMLREAERRRLPVRVEVRLRESALMLLRCLVRGRITGDLVADGAGWLRVTLMFDGLLETRGLLTLGGEVEVLSPPSVRDELVRVAASAASVYADGAGAPAGSER
ncbi:helix-turn-helix transcriptional regulator [Streptomyces sp. JNUCC 64]